jgi:putative transposase
MVTTSSRKAAVEALKEDLGRSERHSCEVVRISRSTLRYERKDGERDLELKTEIRKLAFANKREGYRRITARLRNAGWVVSPKRVRRICVEEGLQLRRKRPRRIQYGPKGEIAKKAGHPNDVWSYDFVEDRTSRNERIRVLSIIDEYTRQALAVMVAPSIGSRELLDMLSGLVEQRGIPGHVRSDNGPEFIANAVKEWLKGEGTETIYIEPGSPWQNGCMESFNGSLRSECLNMNIFHSGKEARIIIDQWVEEYNEHRPHSSLGYISPNEFARRYSG